MDAQRRAARVMSRMVFAAVLSAWAAAAHAQTAEAPRPPCEGDVPIPAYAAVGQPPNSVTWKKIELRPSLCLAWSGKFKLVVALGGGIAHAGDAKSLLARFGAISTMRGMEYFSVTENARRVLLKDAWAVEGPDARVRRADFTPEEMKVGKDLYFVEIDNRSSDPVTYRMRVLAANEKSIEVETQNVTPISAMGLKLIPPGVLLATYFARRLDPQTWGFYGISGTGDEASGLVSLGASSYINRAEALFQHFSASPVPPKPAS